MTLIPALRDALSDPDPHKSQARVHDLVAARIDALTPLSRVTKTDYFNHAWAPDLILTRGDEPERAVFLRFGVKDASFADDLDHLGRSAPIFLDLEAANPSPPPEEITHGEFDLQEALKSVGGGEAMVTDVPAIDRLDDLIRDDREARTATQQVVVGGRGLVDESAAHAIGVGWTVASGAASDADATQLRVALDQVEAYLSRIASLDLETTLRARWIAAGQPAEDFPGREDWNLHDRAPWEIARLVLALLDRKDAANPERWRDIADAISASDLGHELYRIREYREGAAVNELVRAGLGRWTAQYAYVPPLESDSLEAFDWSIGDYSIGLNLISRRAYFTDIGAKWSRVPRANVLPLARERLRTLETPDVRGAGIVTAEETSRRPFARRQR
jgi:hypothetical protein